MSWAEFLIRLFAFKRLEIREWEKVRFISYTTMVAPYQDVKKIPKTMERFLPLGNSEPTEKGISESHKATFMQAYNNYLKQKNG